MPQACLAVVHTVHTVHTVHFDQPRSTVQDHPARKTARLAREKRTVETMIAMYCRDHHGAHGELCAECAALREYAMARLDRCVYGIGKPACAHCPIHCYRKSMREGMRGVMRHSGPRMIREHPVMAIRHLLDSLRKPPATP
jgi:hypothetical protein